MKATSLIVSLLLIGPASLVADDEQVVTLSDGKYVMSGPKGWTKKTPRVNIIEAEFSIPKVEGDAADGRLTVMASGGGVEANVDRWKGQFSKTDMSSVKKMKAGDFEVHLVDITGTFKDQRGPFAPATMRKGYRMMGAIIVMEDGPDYFAKFYGPQKTIGKNSEAFVEFVKTFKKK